MAKKPGSRTEFAFYDVVYEDGSQRSNRRVPTSMLNGQDTEVEARAAIEQQDREIAERSGVPAARIKSIRPAAR